jgi:hypothetical protein
MNEDLLLVDITELIKAYEEGLIKSLSNSSLNEIDINSSIGYLPTLIELQRGLSAAVVASNNTLENIVMPLTEAREDADEKEKSLKDIFIEIKDIFIENSYADCSITDIDGKRQEEVDFFTNETRSKSDFNLLNDKPGEVYYKKRFTNGINARAGNNLTKTLDTWLFGDDGKVKIRGKDFNFGISKCFNCFIDIKLEFISPALEFIFDLSKFINKIKDILKQIDLDMNPMEILKYTCNFAVNFGENLLCPANLKGLNLLLPTLFIKYSADLLKFRLDPSIILGPIIKTIVGSLVSFVENIPRLMFPFIDCIRNAIQTTFQAVISLINSASKIAQDATTLVNKITNAGYKAFLAGRRLLETVGVVQSYESELKGMDDAIYAAFEELLKNTEDYNFLKVLAETEKTTVDNQWVKLIVDFIIWVKNIVDGNIENGQRTGMVVGSIGENLALQNYMSPETHANFLREGFGQSSSVNLLNSLTYDELKFISYERFKQLFLVWISSSNEDNLNIILNAGLDPRDIERELADLESLYDARENAQKRMLEAERKLNELIGRESELIETLNDPVVKNKAKIELVAEDQIRKVPDWDAYQKGAREIASNDSLYKKYLAENNEELAEKRFKEVFSQQMKITTRPMIYSSTRKKPDQRLSINPRDYQDRGEAANILAEAEAKRAKTPREFQRDFVLPSETAATQIGYSGSLADSNNLEERIFRRLNLTESQQQNNIPAGDQWNIGDFMLAKYGLDFSSNYVEGDYKLFGYKKSSEIISGIKSVEKSTTDSLRAIEKMLTSKLDELKNYIQKQVNNVITTFKGFEAFLGEFAQTEISLLGEIKNLLHLIRLLRAVWELVTNGLSNCDKIKNNQDIFKSIIEKTNPGSEVKLNQSKNTLTVDNSNGSTYTLNPNELSISDGTNLVKIDLNDCSDAASHLSVNDRNLDMIYEGILNGIYTSN